METKTKIKSAELLKEECSLGQLAQMLLDIRKIISEYPEPMGYPDKKKCYTITQWNEYLTISNNVYDFNKTLQENRKASEDKRCEIEAAIKKALPKAHIWFITDDVMYALALQENDWPGTPTEILIREKPVYDDMPELKCITSNFN